MHESAINVIIFKIPGSRSGYKKKNCRKSAQLSCCGINKEKRGIITKGDKCLKAILGFLIILCMSLPVLASGDVVTESIGNLTYEIPSDWIVLSQETDENNGVEMCKIFTGQTGMIVEYVPLRTDPSQMSYKRQKMFIFKGIESLKNSFDDYIELENEDYLFEDYAANVRIYSYDDDGETMEFMCNIMYTGAGMAVFMLRGKQPEISGDTNLIEQLDTLRNSIRTVDAEGSDNSADPGSASVGAADFTKYDAGMYKVGADIPAGEYIVFAPGGRGYFCVSSDSNQNDILFNENFDYNSIITIRDGEYLDLTRCYAVPAEENPDVDVSATGMFKVGTHVPAGEYKLESVGGTGYYCIYSDSRQDDIIANDNFDGQNYVTVSDGQYLVLVRSRFTELPAKPVN